MAFGAGLVRTEDFRVTSEKELAPGVWQLSTNQGRLYRIPGCDRPVPSVTNVLGMIAKPALVSWAARVEREAVVHAAVALHEDFVLGGAGKMVGAVYEQTLLKRLGTDKAHVKELAKAGDIGTSTHRLIEYQLRKRMGQPVAAKPPLLLPAAAPCFAAFQRWELEAELEVLSVEQTVWSSSVGYAGSYDFLGTVMMNGKRVTVVGDFKTGKAIYDEALAQVSAYCAAVREMGIVQSDVPLYGLIIRLPKAAAEPDAEFRFVTEAEQVGNMEAFRAAMTLWGWANP